MVVKKIMKMELKMKAYPSDIHFIFMYVCEYFFISCNWHPQIDFKKNILLPIIPNENLIYYIWIVKQNLEFTLKLEQPENKKSHGLIQLSIQDKKHKKQNKKKTFFHFRLTTCKQFSLSLKNTESSNNFFFTTKSSNMCCQR